MKEDAKDTKEDVTEELTKEGSWNEIAVEFDDFTTVINITLRNPAVPDNQKVLRVLELLVDKLAPFPLERLVKYLTNVALATSRIFVRIISVCKVSCI